jgi:FkbM family methyltransferase
VKIERTYVLRSGLAKGLKKRGGLGLRHGLRRKDELSTEAAFLTNLAFAGQTILDVGGADGIYAIFFASRVGPEGRVVCFEPDRVSYEKVLANVRLNGFTNVSVHNVAVGERPGQLEFVYPTDRGRGSADPELAEHHEKDPGAQRVTLPVTSIDAELRTSEQTLAPDFVKIDVEGLELAVLEGMSETASRIKPAIFVELHGLGFEAKEANARRVVEWLHDHDYNILHIESAQPVTPANPEVAREGHLYAS